MAQIKGIYFDRTGYSPYSVQTGGDGRQYATAQNLLRNSAGYYTTLYFTLDDYDIEHSGTGGPYEPTIRILSDNGYTVIAYSSETFLIDNQHSLNWEPDNEEVYPNPEMQFNAPDPYATYSSVAAQEITPNIIVSFYGENEVDGTYAWRNFTIQAPWKWVMPTCTSITTEKADDSPLYLNSQLTLASVKNNITVLGNMSPGSRHVISNDYCTFTDNYPITITRDKITYDYKLKLRVTTGFRAGKTLETEFNYTVYIVTDAEFPDVVSETIETDDPSTLNFKDCIADGSTIRIYYGPGSTETYQTITLNKDWLTSSSDWTTYGPKEINLTLPASSTRTGQSFTYQYNLQVIPPQGVVNVWKIPVNGVTQDVKMVKDSTNKVFWCKPCELTVSGKEYFDSSVFTSVNYPCKTLTSGKNLKDGVHIIHWGDTINLTSKTWTESYNYNPTEDTSIQSPPAVLSTTASSLLIHNGNDYSVDLYYYDPSSCGGEWLRVTTINSNSNYTMSGLAQDTTYTLQFERGRTWNNTQYNTSSNLSFTTHTVGDDIGNQTDLASATITGNKNVIRSWSSSDTISSSTTDARTSSKQTPPLVNLGIWQDTSTQALVNIDNGHHTTKIHYWYVDRNGSHDKTVTLTYEGSIPSTSEWVQKFNDRKITFYAQIIAADGTSYPTSSYNNGPTTTIEIARGDFS